MPSRRLTLAACLIVSACGSASAIERNEERPGIPSLRILGPGVQARFLGSNPGPPVQGVSLDSSQAGPRFEVDGRAHRRLLKIELKGPGDLSLRRRAIMRFRARASVVEQRLVEGKEDEQRWEDLRVLAESDWMRRAFVLKPGADGKVALRSPQRVTRSVRHEGIRQMLSLDLRANLRGGDSFEVTATAGLGPHKADAAWEHEVGIRAADKVGP